MKATIKLYLSDGITKKGYPIKLIVAHKDKLKRKIISYSSLKNWNDKKQTPLETHSDFDALYSKILNIRSLAYSLDFRDITNLDYALQFLLKPKKSNRIDFYQYANKRIEFMKLQNRHGNAEAYISAIVALKKYKPTLFFDEITNTFLENFKIYKLSERRFLKDQITVKIISNSTIRTYLYEIRAIYNSLVRSHEVMDKRPFTGLFLDLKVQKRRAKNIYILKDGFKLLENTKIHNQATQRTVDLTLLQYYLGGLDLIDTYYLKRKQFANGRVILKRTKLGNKAYDFNIKVFDCAQKIIDKYKVDGDYIFPWRKDRTGYATFRSTHNKSLKKIITNLGVNVLPVAAPFTSKSVRHSFATIAKFEHVEVDIIRELMGHERNDIDTIYKDIYPEDVRDKAHLQIITTNL